MPQGHVTCTNSQGVDLNIVFTGAFVSLVSLVSLVADVSIVSKMIKEKLHFSHMTIRIFWPKGLLSNFHTSFSLPIYVTICRDSRLWSLP